MRTLRKAGESRTSWGASGQTKALIVVKGLGQPCPQNLFAAVLGEVKKVVASVGHRQILLPAGCGLDDNLQAGHTIDGDPVAACQKHYREIKVALTAMQTGSCSQRSPGSTEEGMTPCGSHGKYNHVYLPIHIQQNDGCSEMLSNKKCMPSETLQAFTK
jgi:hypothetical protein